MFSAATKPFKVNGNWWSVHNFVPLGVTNKDAMRMHDPIMGGIHVGLLLPLARISTEAMPFR